MTKKLTLILIPFVFIYALEAALAHGQAPERTPYETETQLMLAQLCFNEAGAGSVNGECRAIYQVLNVRRGSRSLQDMMRAYSGRVFDPDRTDRRRFIAFLNAEGTEPAFWNAEIGPWSQYRDRWMRLFTHCGEILEGRVANPCAESVHHWGGNMDSDRFLARHRAVGIEPRAINCGSTRNTFWNVSDRVID